MLTKCRVCRKNRFKTTTVPLVNTSNKQVGNVEVCKSCLPLLEVVQEFGGPIVEKR